MTATVGVGARPAQAVSLSVPGFANIYLAGMPDGSEFTGDFAPQFSPVQVGGIPLAAGSALSVRASGQVGRDPDPFYLTGAEGETELFLTGPGNGLGQMQAPIMALAGVFLALDRPDRTDAPDGLDFSTFASRDFLQLRPGLKQVFFIGDGRTSSGREQTFIVPDGTSRLFLGAFECCEWSNNVGAYEVEVTPVPLPPAGLALLAAIGALGVAARRRDRCAA